MKKLLMMLGLCLIPFYSHAGTQDKFSNPRQAVWRSSVSIGGVNQTILATGAIIIHEIIVDSPTVNNESSLNLFNSTSSAIGSVGASTSIWVNTNVSPSPEPPYFIPYDVPLGSGAVVNKIGGASRTTILWDYVIPRQGDNNIVPYKP